MFPLEQVMQSGKPVKFPLCVCRMSYSIKSKFKFGIKFHSSFGKWVVEMNNEINIAIIKFTFYSLRKHYFCFETISPKWTKEKFKRKRKALSDTVALDQTSIYTPPVSDKNSKKILKLMLCVDITPELCLY